MEVTNLSDRSYEPLVYFYPFESADWRALHDIRDGLNAGSPERATLVWMLDAVEQRARDRFGMVTWNEDDCLVGIARARGIDADEDGFPSREALGVSDAIIREIVERADRGMSDAMIPAGWDLLEYVATEVLREAGLLAGDDERE